MPHRAGAPPRALLPPHTTAPPPRRCHDHDRTDRDHRQAAAGRDGRRPDRRPDGARVRRPLLLPRLARRVHARQGLDPDRRGRPRVHRLLRRRRHPELRPQPPRAEAGRDRPLPRGPGRARPGHVHRRAPRVPPDLRREDPAAPRPGLQGRLPRPGRRERRRGRAEAGPQGHRARVRRELHQRLPRHDPRRPVRHRQLDEARRRRDPPGARHPDALRRLLRPGHPRLHVPRAAAHRRRLRPEQARRRDRRDRAGRGRHQRGPRRVAARPRGALQGARDPADRRRHPDGLRPHRRLLQLRGGGDRAGHGHPVEVHQRLRPPARAHPDQARAGHLGARRAQRHLPRLRPGLRHRHQGDRAVLGR